MGIDSHSKALEYHIGGKIAIEITKPCDTQQDLSLAYTPGVAEPCLEIAKDENLAYQYTNKGNLVAVISDGSAVLGLGDIGAIAGKPVMEGKSVLFLGYGDGVGRAIETARHLEDIDPAILDLRFVKPLDEEKLSEFAGKYKDWFVFSDSARMGGVGSALLELLNHKRLGGVSLTTFEYEDDFITHGDTKLVEESLGILPEQLAVKVTQNINKT